MDMFLIIGFFVLALLIMFSPLMRVKRKRPKAEALFLILSDKEIFALILTNAITNAAAKGGAVTYYYSRLRKVDVVNQILLFDVKYKNFIAKMLRGHVALLGCSERYAYLTCSREELTIFEIQEGKRIGNIKSVIAANPRVKGITTNGMQFDEKRQALLLYDQNGSQYALMGEKLYPVTDFPVDKKVPTIYNVWEGLKLEDRIRYGSFDDIRFEPVPNSRKKFICKRDPLSFTETPYNSSLDTFLEPKSVTLSEGENQKYLLIQHLASLNDYVENIFISKVSVNSKEIWKVTKQQVVAPELLKNELHFFVGLFENRLFITYGERGGLSFSVCEISFATGEVVRAPVLFTNKRKKV